MIAPAEHDDRLVSGPISRTLLLFALPTLASSVLQSLNGSINAAWVGRFLGERALAATTNANLIMFLAFSTVFGFSMAAAILMGHAAGRRDMALVRRIFGTTGGAFISASVLVSLAGWLTAPALLRFLHTPAESFPFAVSYLHLTFAAMPAALTTLLLTTAMRAVGDAITPLWFMGLITALDSTLNPILILGFGPIPRLGIAGSGLASVLANFIGLAAILAWVQLRELPIRLRGPEWRYLWPDTSILAKVVIKGVPMGLQMLVMAMSALAMIGLVNSQGVLTTAAYGAISQIWTYVQLPAMSLGAAVSAMAAQNIGADRWDRVESIRRSGIWISLGLTGGAVVLLALLDRPVLRLFLSNDVAALALAQHVNNVVSWSFLLFGMTMVLSAVVRANGAVIGPLMILIVAVFPVQIGFAYRFSSRLGAEAIWWAFPVGSFASLLLTAGYYRYSGWRLLPPGHAGDPIEVEEQMLAEGIAAGRLESVSYPGR